MAVYNTSEQIITDVYDASENRLTQAYDISENPLMSGAGVPLTVMTYNVQHYTGINSQLTMQQIIIDLYNADIIGLQEFSSNGSTPAVADAVLSEYTRTLSNHTNYMCMAYKSPISNVVVADFVNQDPNDMSQFGETRAYMMADITVGDKTVKWINTHLCLTNEYKYLQMAEILALADEYEYVIVTGDFNAYAYESVSDDEFTQMWKIFFDKGYKCANHQSDGTYTKTYTSAKSASSLNDFLTPTDDIIVSGNIDIDHVWFDTTKLSYLNNKVIDHIPVVARLLI